MPQNVFQVKYERMILQESNLTTRQPPRAPHHVIQATTTSEGPRSLCGSPRSLRGR